MTPRKYAILGIETTCDETSAALVCGGEIVSSVVYSQIKEHEKYHGVVPELASRAHASKIAGVISAALQGRDIDCVAFARGPGLPGGLMVGSVAAQTLAQFKKVPILGVNHLEGHLFACEFEDGQAKRPLEFPLIALLVSGGHTELWDVQDYGRFKRLGRTRDDAAGEAFDKVAKLLGLPYPGGPQVSALALKGRRDAIAFSRPLLPGTWDFSFSGIKTAVSYYLRDHKDINPADICASFEEAVCETLVKKTLRAALTLKRKHIAVGGGVAANTRLRALMEAAAAEHDISVRFVPRALCGDNAAMIALAAQRRLEAAGPDALAHSWPTQIRPDLAVKNWGKKA